MQKTAGGASAIRPASRVRWGIVMMLFVITSINYADRATISIAAPALKKAFELSPVDLGYLFSAFGWSYVISQIPGGWLLDRFGSKRTYFFSIVFWSLFTLLQGAVGFLTGALAFSSLFALRLLVGVAEAPSFPGNSRIVSAWFPNQERGLAAAIFNSAQYFATVLFAPLMGWLVHSYGWPSVFYVMGALGLGVAAVWLKTIYDPKDHPRASASEVQYIEQGGGLVSLDAAGKNANKPKVHTWECIKELLSNRMLLGVYIGQYCITTLTYFFLTWFPVYLVQERHMNILKAGFVAALPALCGFLGGLAGGWLSDRMTKSGFSLAASRKTVIVLGMVLSMVLVAANYVDNNVFVVAVMSLAFFGKGVGALGWAVVADTAPKEAGGLSGSLFNTFGNTAGITTPIIIGYIVAGSGNFSGALLFVAANAAMAIFCYLFIVGDIQRVSLKKSLLAPNAN